MRVLALYGLFLGPAVLAVAQAPLVEHGGVVDAASFKGPVVPGSLVSIFGSNLASGTASASAIPLPVTLGGVSVSFNGIAAPLLYVSSITTLSAKDLASGPRRLRRRRRRPSK